MSTPLTVIGAGLAGLSASYHHGHDGTQIFEAQERIGGHIQVREHNGALWDDGPHISFTKDEYIKELFADAVDGEYEEFESVVRNYYHGWWVDHPAHVALHQVPEPLRSQCLDSFLESREWAKDAEAATDYRTWLYHQFGRVFANTFPAAYTRKYWTLEPEQLDPGFIGNRLGFPNVDEVTTGFNGPLGENRHYISTSRYPTKGGYIAYAKKLADGARVDLNTRVQEIDFGRRIMRLSDGREHTYDDIVSTMPLPTLIGVGVDVPEEVREAGKRLVCTEGYMIEIVADHPIRRPEHWIYVYDLDKFSTRISFMNRWSPHNSPDGTSAIQVEYYGSPFRALLPDRTMVAEKVIEELVEMGIVDDRAAVSGYDVHHVPWANVIFDLHREQSLKTVNDWLDSQGVLRAGRFGHWEYMWTDGAVLTGKAAVESLR